MKVIICRKFDFQVKGFQILGRKNVSKVWFFSPQFPKSWVLRSTFWFLVFQVKVFCFRTKKRVKILVLRSTFWFSSSESVKSLVFGFSSQSFQFLGRKNESKVGYRVFNLGS